MSGVKIVPGRQEYNAAKLRIDHALETLKRELKSMRDQDVALLKHLIKINETIRKLARGRFNSRINQRKAGYSGGAVTVGEGRARLIRQLSEPHDCRIIPEEDERVGSSVGSLDDYVSDYIDDLMSSGSEFEDSTSSLRELRLNARPIPRPRSISIITPAVHKDADSPTTNNSVYEEILRRNIVLWKHRRSAGTEAKHDSVFCEEDEEVDSYNATLV